MERNPVSTFIVVLVNFEVLEGLVCFQELKFQFAFVISWLNAGESETEGERQIEGSGEKGSTH